MASAPSKTWPCITEAGTFARAQDIPPEQVEGGLRLADLDRVGLMFFGTGPFMQVPFTEDLQVCRSLLNEAQARMAGPQIMLGAAVGRAIHVFENSDLKDKVWIVLTDGNDSGSLVPPVKAAEIAGDQGIKIHTIGMGDPTTVGEEKLDVDTLKAMAGKTGGKSFLAITTREVKTLSHRPVRDLYFWTLGFAVVLTLRMMEMGADNLITDEPALLVNLRQQLRELSRADQLRVLRLRDPLLAGGVERAADRNSRGPAHGTRQK